MVRHIGLYDPIARTAEMKETEFTKYTDICNAQTGQTDTKLIDEIRDQFYSYFLDKYGQEVLDRNWDFILPKLEQNAGLASFTLDYNGAKSEYFFPWLISVFTSPSAALEMAYNAGADLAGNWQTEVPETDPINFFVRNDPTFVYNRERQLFVADLATTVFENAWDSSIVGKIVDFGAGRLAWMRWHGFFSQKEYLKIYAFDKDPTIDLSSLFEEDPDELGITFKRGDLTEELRNPDCQNATMVILGGVVSYIPLSVFTEKVIPAIYGLLKPNGYFFFDQQIDCPYLRRSISIFGWPMMRLPTTANEAIGRIESTRKTLWQKGLKFSAEYALDSYNEYPSAVMATLQKI